MWGKELAQSQIHNRPLAEGSCWGMDVCVTPKCVCWNPLCNVIVLTRGTNGNWLTHEGSTLTNEIGALLGQAPAHFLSPELHEDMLSAMCEKWTPPRYRIYQHLDLGHSFQKQAEVPSVHTARRRLGCRAPVTKVTPATVSATFFHSLLH